MTGTFTVIGDEIKIEFAYQADAAKVENTITDASNRLWDQGFGDHGDEENPIVFGDLTNNQKLAIVDQAVKAFIIDNATLFRSSNAAEIARDGALLEAETVYIN